VISLKVGLGYQNFVHPSAPRSEPLALPVRIVDRVGTILAEGVTKAGAEPTEFMLPSSDDPVFVRLAWPSGKIETKRVELKGKKEDEVTFDDASIRRNEWSSWAVPRLNEETSLAQTSESVPVAIDRYNRVWLRLWRRKNGSWVDSDIHPTAKFKNDAARQIEFDLKPGAWLLQLGGARVPWRFVSLPGGGPCRVLLTPNESIDPRSDPLKVVVSGFRNGAETLLEFLSRDSLSAATSLSTWAMNLLRDKFNDPVAATIAAYYVLRVGTWREVPEWWLGNLSESFTWLADGPLIRCVVDLRRGLQNAEAAGRARFNLLEAMGRGYPLFVEGLSLLQEARAVLGGDDAVESAKIESLVASRAWAGGSLSFYGELPDHPSPTKMVGAPFQGRPAPKRRPKPARTAAPKRLTFDDAKRLTFEEIASDSFEVTLRTPDELRYEPPHIAAERPAGGHRPRRNVMRSTSKIAFLGDFDKPAQEPALDHTFKPFSKS
jgi:hypothetical protein